MTIVQPKQVYIYRDEDKVLIVKPRTGKLTLTKSEVTGLQWIIESCIKDFRMAISYEEKNDILDKYKHITVQLGVSIRNLIPFLEAEVLL